MNLPLDFQQRVSGVHGAAGETWLRNLAALLEETSLRWSLRLLPPFELLSYNYVAPATCANRQAVLKAGVPHRLLRNEIAALRYYDGRGAVQLLAADPEASLLRLERLQPGTPLTEAGSGDHGCDRVGDRGDAPALAASPTAAARVPIGR